jgi:nucleoside-diphosphate-sugar epimerase
MRHVITGGSGFTGLALARRLLEKGAEVVIFDVAPVPPALPASSVQFAEGDVTHPEDLAKLSLGPADVVYHLAARQFGAGVPSRGRDGWFSSVNVVGTRNVIAAMQAGGAHRLVFFSTDMTYGKPYLCPVPADHPQNPIGPYGRSKVEAERVIMGAENIQATIFRPRLITGPGRLGILGRLFRLIRAGLPVPMIGAGTNRYQMVGVDDCARAALQAVDADCPAGPFNLGSSEPPTTRELLQGIIAHARSNSFLIPVPANMLKPILGGFDWLGMPLLFPEQYGIADLDILLDTSETRKVLGWTPLRDDIEMMNAAYDAFCQTQ